MIEAAIDVKEVTYRIGDCEILQSVHLKLRMESGGKIVSIMGPSGVGKSTLCELILGVKKPTSGTISISHPAGIAYIPQRAILFDQLSVSENIGVLKHSQTVGSTFREDRVETAIDRLELRQAVQNGTPVSKLSLGESQRVMLARLQAISCGVLVLDEPCSSLDNRTKAGFLTALSEVVTNDELLAVLVTHDWAEAVAVSSEIVYLARTANGKRVYHMSLNEFAENPPTVDAMYAVYWPNCSVKSAEHGIIGRSHNNEWRFAADGVRLPKTGTDANTESGGR